MNRRIITSLSLIAAVAAVVMGGTSAFFSDTETSTGNTFTAGAIDLKVSNHSYYNGREMTNLSWSSKDLETGNLFFNFADLKPGDLGEDTIDLTVNNNDAYACMDIDVTGTPENGINEPEADDDTTAGIDEGELQDELHMTFWADDGDNVLELDEESTIFVNNKTIQEISDGGTVTLADSVSNVWSGTGAMTGATTYYIGKVFCFGNLTQAPVATDAGENPSVASGFTCSGATVTNASQTDGVTGNVSFTAIQSRNNGSFECGEETVTVNADDLETASKVAAVSNGKWFFYNDTNDTVMTINQFSGTGGVNDIVAGPDSVGAAQMTLDAGVDPRYNIATYKYKDVKLSSIGSLKYRMYDATVSSETPYLNFNVDFDNSDTWQRRLVQVPTGVVANTWTTVDALAGMWHLSGGNWPVGVNTAVPFAGSTDRTWASIVADYPNAETRSTDSWLGVRVGHPGPTGATGYVDWIEFDGETTDFEN